MSNSVTILGAKGGPALRQPDAMPTSSLLHVGGNPIVVDCGLGVTRSLVKCGVDLRDITTIFITHLHSDHLLELGPLIHTAWTTGTGNVISVYGPPGIGTYLDNFIASMSFDNDIRVADEGRVPLASILDVHVISPGDICQIGLVTASALRVPHPPVTDCFALRFDWPDHRVTFSADTAYFPPLAEFAEGSHILVHEAMLPDGIEDIIAKTGLGDDLRRHLHASHTTAEDAARIANTAQVKHLVLNHLLPADDARFSQSDWENQVTKHFAGQLSVGFGGLCIEIPAVSEGSNT